VVRVPRARKYIKCQQTLVIQPLRYPGNLIDEEWEILQPIVHGATCQQTFPLTDWLTLTTTNGWTIERWEKSILRYVSISVKKSRNPDQTAAIVDSQRIKGTPESYLESGVDGGKLISRWIHR